MLLLQLLQGWHRVGHRRPVARVVPDARGRQQHHARHLVGVVSASQPPVHELADHVARRRRCSIHGGRGAVPCITTSNFPTASSAEATASRILRSRRPRNRTATAPPRQSPALPAPSGSSAPSRRLPPRRRRPRWPPCHRHSLWSLPAAAARASPAMRAAAVASRARGHRRCKPVQRIKRGLIWF